MSATRNRSNAAAAVPGSVAAAMLIADLADDRTAAYARAAVWLKATHGLSPRQVLRSERDMLLAGWLRSEIDGGRPL